MKRSILALPILSLIALACAAQDLPAPPKPADDGLNLADAMKFIQDSVASIGPVNYVVYVQLDVNGAIRSGKISVEGEESNVRVRVQDCRMDYHSWLTNDGRVIQDEYVGFSMKDVRQVTVKTLDQTVREENAEQPGLTFRVEPPVFVISVKKSDPTAHPPYIPLFDESLANRIAKALLHAADLCGGGNKGPL